MSAVWHRLSSQQVITESLHWFAKQVGCYLKSPQVRRQVKKLRGRLSPVTKLRWKVRQAQDLWWATGLHVINRSYGLQRLQDVLPAPIRGKLIFRLYPTLIVSAIIASPYLQTAQFRRSTPVSQRECLARGWPFVLISEEGCHHFLK